MSSDEASSSEPEIVSKKTHKKPKAKGKKTHQPSVVTPHGKNEGTDTDWAYKPPEGAVLAKTDVDAEEFDWDALRNNEDVELWIVRVPEGVKPKHLEGLKLDAPSSSKTARIGSLTRKHTTYDVWSLGEDQNDAVGAEEIKNFSCMVPRRNKDGKLFLAPDVTTRHIALSARPTEPTKVSDTENADISWSTHQNPPRPSYPKELLKHRFMPYGSLAPTEKAVDAMDVDEPSAAASPSKKEKSSPVKHKKRKIEDGGSKKVKKA